MVEPADLTQQLGDEYMKLAKDVQQCNHNVILERTHKILSLSPEEPEAI